jgi:hypothetical protein
MFARFRIVVCGAALSFAVLSIPITCFAQRDTSTLADFKSGDPPGIVLTDANLEPMWIVYWWSPNDPDASVTNRARHNCGRGPLGRAYALQLQRDLRKAGYNAVVVSKYGE